MPLPDPLDGHYLSCIQSEMFKALKPVWNTDQHLRRDQVNRKHLHLRFMESFNMSKMQTLLLSVKSLECGAE